MFVASAGDEFDHVTAVDILRTIKSANGFTVVIILKPFSFEGQRRQDEVKRLVGKLQEHTNLFIDVDTDMLLRKDLVTLDEAVKTANNAVLLAINAISVLISERHRKFIDVSHGDVKEVHVSELTKVSFQDHSLMHWLLMDLIYHFKFVFCFSLRLFLMTYDDLAT